jgi:hypothetical protein
MLPIESKIEAVKLLVLREYIEGDEAHRLQEDLFDSLDEEARGYAAERMLRGLKNFGDSGTALKQDGTQAPRWTFERKRILDGKDFIDGKRKDARMLVRHTVRIMEEKFLQEAMASGELIFGAGLWGPIPARGAKVIKLKPWTSFTIRWGITKDPYGSPLSTPGFSTKCIHWANWCQSYGATCGKLALSPERRALVRQEAMQALELKQLLTYMDPVELGEIVDEWMPNKEREEWKAKTLGIHYGTDASAMKAGA